MKKKILFTLGFIFPALFMASNMAQGVDLPKLSVFHSPSCHRCVEVKKDILPQIEGKFKDKLDIEYYDIADIKNYAFLFGLKEKYNKDFEITLPVFFINGQLINGRGDVKSNLEIAINVALGESPRSEPPIMVDLVRHFNGFKPLAIAGSGLIDGINPCAFTVIVFFISYLAFQGYKKLELIIIGLTFIFSVFLTYLLIGLGIFNFLYQINSFWVISRVFNISIGIISLILGGAAIYDLLKFRKTQDTQGLLLQLPRVVKNKIHSIIGLHYRKTGEPEARKPLFGRLVKLIISAFVTGFLVSILEAVCTGQLYLPVISFILKTTPFKLKAFGYLIVYNIMFIVPLFIIFILALFGVTSGAFAQFIRKHMASIKLLMSIVFIGLGISLVWRG
ncbi:MAG: hypothetical protein PHY88_05705 [Candidatus Omnitrophica bacterium]|nr:hypothetical protein [Candidatus Omnitrophota bacterium]